MTMMQEQPDLSFTQAIHIWNRERDLIAPPAVTDEDCKILLDKMFVIKRGHNETILPAYTK